MKTRNGAIPTKSWKFNLILIVTAVFICVTVFASVRTSALFDWRDDDSNLSSKIEAAFINADETTAQNVIITEREATAIADVSELIQYINAGDQPFFDDNITDDLLAEITAPLDEETHYRLHELERGNGVSDSDNGDSDSKGSESEGNGDEESNTTYVIVVSDDTVFPTVGNRIIALYAQDCSVATADAVSMTEEALAERYTKATLFFAGGADIEEIISIPEINSSAIGDIQKTEQTSAVPVTYSYTLPRESEAILEKEVDVKVDAEALPEENPEEGMEPGNESQALPEAEMEPEDEVQAFQAASLNNFEFEENITYTDVSTYAQFKAAILAGNPINLKADISITENVGNALNGNNGVDKDVVIDGNGHTLTFGYFTGASIYILTGNHTFAARNLTITTPNNNVGSGFKLASPTGASYVWNMYFENVSMEGNSLIGRQKTSDEIHITFEATEGKSTTIDVNATGYAYTVLDVSSLQFNGNADLAIGGGLGGISKLISATNGDVQFNGDKTTLKNSRTVAYQTDLITATTGDVTFKDMTLEIKSNMYAVSQVISAGNDLIFNGVAEFDINDSGAYAPNILKAGRDIRFEDETVFTKMNKATNRFIYAGRHVEFTHAVDITMEKTMGTFAEAVGNLTFKGVELTSTAAITTFAKAGGTLTFDGDVNADAKATVGTFAEAVGNLTFKGVELTSTAVITTFAKAGGTLTFDGDVNTAAKAKVTTFASAGTKPTDNLIFKGTVDFTPDSGAGLIEVDAFAKAGGKVEFIKELTLSHKAVGATTGRQIISAAAGDISFGGNTNIAIEVAGANTTTVDVIAASTGVKFLKEANVTVTGNGTSDANRRLSVNVIKTNTGDIKFNEDETYTTTLAANGFLIGTVNIVTATDDNVIFNGDMTLNIESNIAASSQAIKAGGNILFHKSATINATGGSNTYDLLIAGGNVIFYGGTSFKIETAINHFIKAGGTVEFPNDIELALTKVMNTFVDAGGDLTFKGTVELNPVAAMTTFASAGGNLNFEKDVTFTSAHQVDVFAKAGGEVLKFHEILNLSFRAAGATTNRQLISATAGNIYFGGNVDANIWVTGANNTTVDVITASTGVIFGNEVDVTVTGNGTTDATRRLSVNVITTNTGGVMFNGKTNLLMTTSNPNNYPHDGTFNLVRATEGDITFNKKDETNTAAEGDVMSDENETDKTTLTASGLLTGTVNMVTATGGNVLFHENMRLEISSNIAAASQAIKAEGNILFHKNAAIDVKGGSNTYDLLTAGGNVIFYGGTTFDINTALNHFIDAKGNVVLPNDIELILTRRMNTFVKAGRDLTFNGKVELKPTDTMITFAEASNGDLTFNGAVVFETSSAVTTFASASGSLTFMGAVTFTASETATAAKVTTFAAAAQGRVYFNEDLTLMSLHVDGAGNPQLISAPTGDVYFNGNVKANILVTGNTDTTVDVITAATGVTFVKEADVTIKGNGTSDATRRVSVNGITTATGGILFNGKTNLVLTANANQHTGIFNMVTATEGDITFNEGTGDTTLTVSGPLTRTVNMVRAMATNTEGNITFNDDTTLTVSDTLTGTVNMVTATKGNITFIKKASLTASGTISGSGTVNTITADTGSITFNDETTMTVGGSITGTVNMVTATKGNIIFIKQASLTASGTISGSGIVNMITATEGDITFNESTDDTTLTVSGSITGTVNMVSAAKGNITFYDETKLIASGAVTGIVNMVTASITDSETKGNVEFKKYMYLEIKSNISSDSQVISAGNNLIFVELAEFNFDHGEASMPNILKAGQNVFFQNETVFTAMNKRINCFVQAGQNVNFTHPVNLVIEKQMTTFASAGKNVTFIDTVDMETQAPLSNFAKAEENVTFWKDATLAARGTVTGIVNMVTTTNGNVEFKKDMVLEITANIANESQVISAGNDLTFVQTARFNIVHEGNSNPNILKAGRDVIFKQDSLFKDETGYTLNKRINCFISAGRDVEFARAVDLVIGKQMTTFVEAGNDITFIDTVDMENQNQLSNFAKAGSNLNFDKSVTATVKGSLTTFASAGVDLDFKQSVTLETEAPLTTFATAVRTLKFWGDVNATARAKVTTFASAGTDLTFVGIVNFTPDSNVGVIEVESFAKAGGSVLFEEALTLHHRAVSAANRQIISAAEGSVTFGGNTDVKIGVTGNANKVDIISAKTGVEFLKDADITVTGNGTNDITRTLAVNMITTTTGGVTFHGKADLLLTTNTIAHTGTMNLVKADAGDIIFGGETDLTANGSFTGTVNMVTASAGDIVFDSETDKTNLTANGSLTGTVNMLTATNDSVISNGDITLEITSNIAAASKMIDAGKNIQFNKTTTINSNNGNNDNNAYSVLTAGGDVAFKGILTAQLNGVTGYFIKSGGTMSTRDGGSIVMTKNLNTYLVSSPNVDLGGRLTINDIESVNTNKNYFTGTGKFLVADNANVSINRTPTTSNGVNLIYNYTEFEFGENSNFSAKASTNSTVSSSGSDRTAIICSNDNAREFHVKDGANVMLETSLRSRSNSSTGDTALLLKKSGGTNMNISVGVGAELNIKADGEPTTVTDRRGNCPVMIVGSGSSTTTISGKLNVYSENGNGWYYQYSDSGNVDFIVEGTGEVDIRANNRNVAGMTEYAAFEAYGNYDTNIIVRDGGKMKVHSNGYRGMSLFCDNMNIRKTIKVEGEGSRLDIFGVVWAITAEGRGEREFSALDGGELYLTSGSGPMAGDSEGMGNIPSTRESTSKGSTVYSKGNMTYTVDGPGSVLSVRHNTGAYSTIFHESDGLLKINVTDGGYMHVFNNNTGTDYSAMRAAITAQLYSARKHSINVDGIDSTLYVENVSNQNHGTATADLQYAQGAICIGSVGAIRSEMNVSNGANLTAISSSANPTIYLQESTLTLDNPGEILVMNRATGPGRGALASVGMAVYNGAFNRYLSGTKASVPAIEFKDCDVTVWNTYGWESGLEYPNENIVEKWRGASFEAWINESSPTYKAGLKNNQDYFQVVNYGKIGAQGNASKKSVAADSPAGRDGSHVDVGDNITYEVTYVNNKADAQRLTVVDHLPDTVKYIDHSAFNSATGESVPGVYDPESHTITWVDIAVDGAPDDGEPISETATVEVEVLHTTRSKIINKGELTWTPINPDTGQPDESKKNTQWVRVVNPIASRKVLAKGSLGTVENPAAHGDLVTFEIHYRNPCDKSSDVIIEDILDDDLIFVSSWPPLDDPEETKNLSWRINDVRHDYGGKIRVTVVVDKNATSEVVINEAVMNWLEGETQTREAEVHIGSGENIATEFTFYKVDAEDYSPMPEVSFNLYYCNELRHTPDDHGHLGAADNCWELLGDDIESQSNGNAGRVDLNFDLDGAYRYYLLTETRTHANYELPMTGWIIFLESNGDVSFTPQDKSLFDVEFLNDQDINGDGEDDTYLRNYQSNYVLPKSGGGGIYWLVIPGCLLILTGLTIIIRARRKGR